MQLAPRVPARRGGLNVEEPKDPPLPPLNFTPPSPTKIILASRGSFPRISWTTLVTLTPTYKCQTKEKSGQVPGGGGRWD